MGKPLDYDRSDDIPSYEHGTSYTVNSIAPTDAIGRIPQKSRTEAEHRNNLMDFVAMADGPKKDAGFAAGRSQLSSSTVPRV